MRCQGVPSNIQFQRESNSLEIGSLAGRVSTHHAMDKLVLSKMPKENSQMIKIHSNSSWNIFITLITLIPSHSVPPTHPWCLVTPMTLVLLLIPQSSSKLELLPPTSKCTLLVAIFIPDISYCHRYAIRYAIRSTIGYDLSYNLPSLLS